MSNKGPKIAKPQKQKPKAKRKKTGISLLAVVLGIATLIGVPAAIVAFVPRVTAVVSDPPNNNDPFSSSITITNTGTIPLDSVTASISFGTIQFFGPQGQPITLLGDEAGDDLGVSKWPPHDLGLDDRFTVSLNDSFTGNRKTLVGAQIALIVKYELPLVHIRGEKRFPVVAKRATNGNFYWYADTVLHKAN
jgi:hypothetical protein